jgi:hypothetical protein
MNQEIKIYFFSICFIFSPFVIYKGYIDGKEYYKKNGCDVKNDLIKIPQDGLENYTIFLNICLYELVFCFISFITSIIIYFVKYFMI